MPKEVRDALTAAKVRQEKRPGRYADGNGLYLHVSETGARWWIWRGTVHGRRVERGMGSSRLIDLKEARDIARAWRRIARDGGDPKAERDKAKRESLSFEAAARKVHAEQVEGHGKSAKYRRQWINSLQTHAFPMIGARPVHAVTQGDILRVLAPIWGGKPVLARMVRQRMQTVFSWARTAGHRDADNPVDDIEQGLPKHRHRVQHYPALPFADLPDLMRRLAAVEGVAEFALRFLILTAARSDEARSVTWGEVDLESAVWTVPGERMKGDLLHRVPLSAPALTVLQTVRGLDDDRVFPGQRRGRPISDTTIAAPLKRMGVSGTVHGFRSTFRDWAAERTSVPREIAELCLAHEVGSAVERSYRRSDLLDKRRSLMDQWGRFCLSAGRRGDVVALRR
jgi:integrase